MVRPVPCEYLNDRRVQGELPRFHYGNIQRMHGETVPVRAMRSARKWIFSVVLCVASNAGNCMDTASSATITAPTCTHLCARRLRDDTDPNCG